MIFSSSLNKCLKSLFNFVPQIIIMQEELSTEEKIKEAAKRVFVAKGFDGCSSREIAKEAGMNVALVNYYFKSKQALFQLVFNATMEDFMMTTIEVFSQELDLVSKMRIFIEREYEFLAKYPEMPGFILKEVCREDGCFTGSTDIMKQVEESGVFHEIAIAQEKGELRKMDMTNIMLLIMANCQYPFMAKELMKELRNATDEQYKQYLTLHKQYITEMLIAYLFIDKK